MTKLKWQFLSLNASEKVLVSQEYIIFVPTVFRQFSLESMFLHRLEQT